MREIIFRAKTEDGDWTYGYYVFVPKRTGTFGQTMSCVDFDSHYILTKHFNFAKEINPETVGQYTGLRDKNGKKIFEGDIVKYTQYERFSDDDELKEAEIKNKFIDVIKFVNGKFIPLPQRCDCEDYWYSFATDDYEVIGNLHDNPELLKEGVSNA